MHQIMRVSLMTVALFALGITVQAQWGPAGGPWRPERVSALIDHVHEDLNHGYAAWRLSGGDRGRLDRAEHQLRDFAKHWESGKFDKDNLDSSIGAIQKTINDNHLNGRERDALWNDVTQLRKMREAYDRHEIGRW
jgi:hypothetical protein